jgi:methylmalonyl-CoA/ethylmalonyl-CoA epimerase
MPDELKLSALGQIGVSVTSLERSVPFYRDLIGLKFLFQAPNVAFFDCGGIRLMLALHEHPETPFNGTVLYFRVDEIQRAHAELVERGITMETEPHLIARMPDHDLWMSFFRDPDRNLFGLMAEVRK